MKAYNTPKDELHIESDTGETLVSITPEKTTIANLEGGAGGSQFYIVDLIYNDDESESFSKTFTEIVNAYNNGQIPLLVFNVDGQFEFYKIIEIADDYLTFKGTSVSVHDSSTLAVTVSEYLLNDSNSITVTVTGGYVSLTPYM